MVKKMYWSCRKTLKLCKRESFFCLEDQASYMWKAKTFELILFPCRIVFVGLGIFSVCKKVARRLLKISKDDFFPTARTFSFILIIEWRYRSQEWARGGGGGKDFALKIQKSLMFTFFTSKLKILRVFHRGLTQILANSLVCLSNCKLMSVMAWNGRLHRWEMLTLSKNQTTIFPTNYSVTGKTPSQKTFQYKSRWESRDCSCHRNAVSTAKMAAPMYAGPLSRSPSSPPPNS